MTSANEIEIINSSELLEATSRAEIDMQIATAKRYPRNIATFLNKVETYATMDIETAEDCFYALRRGGKVIDGESIRMAEIVANAWGNMRVQTRITANDGKTITVTGIAHDLETNLAVSQEVKRRITDKDGRTFNEDMQVMTGNAASSIAYRNVVFKIVPKAITKKVFQNVKQVAMGKAIDLQTSRQNALLNFQKAGVSEEMVLSYLDCKTIEEIDKEMLFLLRGTWNAIKDGTTTIQDTFIKPMVEKKMSEEVMKKAKETKEKVERSMNMKANPETAEVSEPQEDESL